MIILREKLTGIIRDNEILFIFCHTNSSRQNQYHFFALNSDMLLVSFSIRQAF